MNPMFSGNLECNEEEGTAQVQVKVGNNVLHFQEYPKNVDGKTNKREV